MKTFPLRPGQCGRGFALAGDSGSEDYKFWLFVISGKLDFGAAHWELTSGEIAGSPDLVQEVTASHAMEHELGFRRGFAVFTRV